MATSALTTAKPWLAPRLNFIQVLASEQQMYVFRDGIKTCSYTISTAANGLGEQLNSFKTPRCWHQIRAKIGNGAPLNTVFRSRRPTGEIYNQELDKLYPDRDWILTRIMWLSGLVTGFNRLAQVDTMQRYIYLHGGSDYREFGVANSKGCIRMKNADIVELFNAVAPGHLLHISERRGICNHCGQQF